VHIRAARAARAAALKPLSLRGRGAILNLCTFAPAGLFRASKTVLEEFGRCNVVVRFLSGSKHAKQFLEAGDRLATSYTTLCHAVSINLALDFARDLSVSARSVVTVEDAQSCSWFMRSDELVFDYREVKKGQPAKEIRLGKPGSFGDVFSATHCDRAQVAVKKLKIPTKASDVAASAPAAVAFAAFVREVSFAFSLKHPNIVRTLGGVVDCQEEPPCWIIMERLSLSLAEVTHSRTFAALRTLFCVV
jgi:hypothetical protein